VWRNYQKSASQRDRRDAARKPSRLEEALIELQAVREHNAELEAAIEALRDENQRLKRRARRDVPMVLCRLQTPRATLWTRGATRAERLTPDFRHT
jgi:hypothetical protein